MRALVFSAGGTFGAYQAGVWQALEERGFRPEIVVGASVGAVNATAVARGCTGKRLQEWWRDPASNVFHWNWPPRGLALLDGRALESRLKELLQEFSRPLGGVRLSATVTELPSTRIRVISDEHVTPRTLLASCAVPLVHAPVALEGRWYMDGGLFCRLPLRVAAEAGASDIVSVDLLAAPPSALLRGMMNAVLRVRGLWVREPMSLPEGIREGRVEPHEPLGGPFEMLRWELSRVDRWIDAGYRDAAAAWERFSRESHASAAQPSSPTVERTAPI